MRTTYRTCTVHVAWLVTVEGLSEGPRPLGAIGEGLLFRCERRHARRGTRPTLVASEGFMR
jgi:hypothetical protein